MKTYSVQRQVIKVQVYAIVDEGGNARTNSNGCLDIYDSNAKARGVVERLNSRYERAKEKANEPS